MSDDLISRKNEEWKDIIGYEGRYQISNTGKVRNTKTNRIRAIHAKGKYGHAQVSLFDGRKNKRFQIHRLVAIHFIPNPDAKPEVCHIDNTLGENGLLDNSTKNLMWGTHKENCEFENTRKRQSENHADYHGENNPNYGKHLSDETKERMMKKRGRQVLQWEDGRVIAFYESLKHAGRITGIAWQNIKNVCDKKYQHAGGYGWSYAKDSLKIVEKGGIE